MSDVDGLLPDEAERALYLAVLEKGGRVLLRDVTAEDMPAALRLMEIGLLVHYRPDESLSAVNPRAIGEKIGTELRSAGMRLLARAEETPALLAELVHHYDLAERRTGHIGAVSHIEDPEEIRHRLTQLETELRYEAMSAQAEQTRPAAHLAEMRDRIRGFLDRGGVARTIYRAEVKADPATVEYAATVSEWGYRIRVLSEPFTRVLIFDRRVAVIPAAADNSSAAFVEDPAVVDFLVGVFERDWARAEPVWWETLAEPGDGTPVHEQVGRLLAQGLTQRAVANRLGLSERTVAGHIARLRELYDADTLYQLGWLMRGQRGGEPR
ncbi:LuxR family transcriptional regulator [Kitasatospora sp. MMS16-BH015]|uniref:LuxR family transcriptional regulator n=1 Tax=Kitasatospora sp. MMS16-BH015 TaxID=2018025 RepID=UPI000CA3DB94|nr:LuxR family transcriptional regulator [Kitasatospora sp. MMS16-BH015]AUG78445.1 LuxR family transcriptional regulator [Kitasatospora sp. MMS16-BH015]